MTVPDIRIQVLNDPTVNAVPTEYTYDYAGRLTSASVGESATPRYDLTAGIVGFGQARQKSRLAGVPMLPMRQQGPSALEAALQPSHMEGQAAWAPDR